MARGLHLYDVFKKALEAVGVLKKEDFDSKLDITLSAHRDALKGADNKDLSTLEADIESILAKLRTEPDFGKLLIGRFTYIKLFAQNLENAIDSPIELNDILIYPEPVMADVLGSDYEEGTVEASAGSTNSSSISKTFTSIITNAVRIAGIIQVGVSVYLELRQVDSDYAGTAKINSITVELLKYDVASGTATSIASKSKTVNKSISGTATANTTFSELFTIPIDFDSPLELDRNNLLQLKVTVNFEATTDASATTTTIAAARINFARGSDETFVMLPVV